VLTVSRDELCDFGERPRRPEAARVFNAIAAGALECHAERGLLSELSGFLAIILGWAVFLVLVLLPQSQLIALFLCAAALLIHRDRPTSAHGIAGSGMLPAAA
jgi:hypothetical protein